MGAAERFWEIVTSQGTDERQAEGQEGNIYRLGQTVRRGVIRVNESSKGKRTGSEENFKEWTGRRKREVGVRDADVVHTSAD